MCSFLVFLVSLEWYKSKAGGLEWVGSCFVVLLIASWQGHNSHMVHITITAWENDGGKHPFCVQNGLWMELKAWTEEWLAHTPGLVFLFDIEEESSYILWGHGLVPKLKVGLHLEPKPWRHIAEFWTFVCEIHQKWKFLHCICLSLWIVVKPFCQERDRVVCWWILHSHIG